MYERCGERARAHKLDFKTTGFFVVYNTRQLFGPSVVSYTRAINDTVIRYKLSTRATMGHMFDNCIL